MPAFACGQNCLHRGVLRLVPGWLWLKSSRLVPWRGRVGTAYPFGVSLCQVPCLAGRGLGPVTHRRGRWCQDSHPGWGVRARRHTPTTGGTGRAIWWCCGCGSRGLFGGWCSLCGDGAGLWERDRNGGLRCAWFSRRRWGCLGVIAVGVFGGFLRWCSTVGCFLGHALCGGCASSAGLGHWGLVPKRWLRLGRARPRAPRARPIWVGDPVGCATVKPPPFVVFPSRLPQVVVHWKHTPSGRGYQHPTLLPAGKPYRWRGHAAQTPTPRFRSPPHNNTNRTTTNPAPKGHLGTPATTHQPCCPQRTPAVGVCGRAAPRLLPAMPPTRGVPPQPTTNQKARQPTPHKKGTPRPTTVGHQPQPPTGVKAGTPRTHQNQKLADPNHQRAKRRATRFHRNQPTTARREADTPNPLRGGCVNHPHTRTKPADRNP